MRFVPEYSKRKLNGIYVISNSIDSRVYIGKCTNFYKRYGRHKSMLQRGVHYNSKLQSFVNKYGIDTLSFDILEIADDDLIDREMYYIIKYDSINAGFNIILDSRTMAHITNEERRRESIKLKGIKRDEEFCRKVADGVRTYYANNPKKSRAKWTEARRQARIKYMAEHPERYANRKPSTGNKTNHLRGSRQSNAKLTEDIVYQVKKNIMAGVKRSDTINQFGLSVSAYKDIQRGRTWRHVIIEEYEN